jgi:hypothetical protein
MITMMMDTRSPMNDLESFHTRRNYFLQVSNGLILKLMSNLYWVPHFEGERLFIDLLGAI